MFYFFALPSQAMIPPPKIATASMPITIPMRLFAEAGSDGFNGVEVKVAPRAVTVTVGFCAGDDAISMVG
jgi:hypothetical protein